MGLWETVIEDRKKVGSIMGYKFNKKRIKMVNSSNDIPPDGQCIVYWMFREQRVDDNWGLLLAQKKGLQLQLPLVVLHCLLPSFGHAGRRQFMFSLRGLRQVEHDLGLKGIRFVQLKGFPHEVIPPFVQKVKCAGLVCDQFPIRVMNEWVDGIKEQIPANVPFIMVDGHNVVPVWEASDKQEYAARTIRNKIQVQLPNYLVQFPELVDHDVPDNLDSSLFPSMDWDKVYAELDVDESIKESDWIEPGSTNAFQVLESFIKNRLKDFATARNDPNKDVLSNLSPYFHFGQLSPQRACFEVKKMVSKANMKEGVACFLEEAIVRRELSDNFCYYNPLYDSVEGASDWAKTSLRVHATDKREWVYTEQELEQGVTHDDLWNAAQQQLVQEGKMHGFLRMYWAKKILEWTVSPEEALRISIHLNDKYSYDGRDPNGFVGCMWSICGIHDMGWKERPVFGKIRFMNYAGCNRKFDINMFQSKYLKGITTKPMKMKGEKRKK